MHMEPFHWKKSQTLAEDYISDPERTNGLFSYHYQNERDWQQRAAWLTEENAAPRADRARLVDVLTGYNRRVGNKPAAMEQIAALNQADALTIVGGQQAGLFGGPLLVLYKAITIVQLAKQWSEKLQRPVVPVFWIAGEDHDFDEVNHLYTLTSAQQVEKLKVDHPTGHRTSVSKLPLKPEAWKEALEGLDRTLMDTEFKADLMAKINRTMEGPTTLSDAFAAFMAELFGDYGLVLIDSDEPALRQLEAPMFEQLVMKNENLTESLLQSRSHVQAAGYQAQADVAEDGANLFIYAGGQRLLLHREGDQFTDKKKDFTYTRKQLHDLALTTPEQLSNNVMTRPLMQDFLFPVLAAVLGPGEIAYWALTKQAFELYGMRMPIIAPRLEFTLLEGTVLKYMNKYNITLADVIEQRYEQKKQHFLDAQDTLQLNERFAAVKAEFRAGYTPLVESLNAINPGVKKLGETNLAKIIEQIEFLEHKATDAYRMQFDSALRQLERIRLTILPLAKPQERVYNGCAYINRYGSDWLHTLLTTPIPVDGLHRVYYL
ncbi:bacillithiol biosynthesis cysteine-adding enzyme BshC [Paenibacillus aestuarii]|uniref:Putative cysteine ligase BshC n=1 Tax=Paenibacillus aestuarii TaxID=516965 RepID=A0ABW0K9Z0_9BACL|nr:bacillithiol biosynthesis cysteine-adding enzyme BshC [Paenibacillus aestuarii]